ncbi:hypothetical protein Tco_0409886 [Tanacetum coccineum]
MQREGRRKECREQAAKDRYWKIPICYADDEDDTIALTPVLLTRSQLTLLILKGGCASTTHPNQYSGNLDIDEIVVNFNDDSTSSDDDSPYGKDIDYVDASPPDSELVSLEVVEIVIPKVGGIDTDILLTIKDDILREKLLNVNLLIAKIEALKDNPTPSSNVMTKSSSTSLNFFLEETNTVDNSLPETKTFFFNLEKISSGNTTTHSNFSQYDSFIFDLSINPCPPADRSDCYHEEFAGELAHIISPPEYDCFYFKNEPELGDFTIDVVEDNFDNPTREPRVHAPNILPTHPTLHLDSDFTLSSDSLGSDLIFLSRDAFSISFIRDPLFNTLLPFSSENEDKVVKTGILVACEEQSPLFAYVVWIFLAFLTYPVSPPYLLSIGNEDTIFDPGHPFSFFYAGCDYHRVELSWKFQCLSHST